MADDACKALYDDMIAGGGAGIPKETGQINVVVNTSSYDLNARVYRLTSIWVPVSGANAFTEIGAFQDREVAALLSAGLSGGATQPQFMRYQLRTPSNGPTAAPPVLDLLPVPQVAFTLGYRYVPTPIITGAGGAPTYYEVGNGWDEVIIWSCVAQIAGKMDADASFAFARLAAAQQRVMNMATERDSNEPDRVVDFQRDLRDYAAGWRRYARRFPGRGWDNLWPSLSLATQGCPDWKNRAPCLRRRWRRTLVPHQWGLQRRPVLAS